MYHNYNTYNCIYLFERSEDMSKKNIRLLTGIIIFIFIVFGSYAVIKLYNLKAVTQGSSNSKLNSQGNTSDNNKKSKLADSSDSIKVIEEREFKEGNLKNNDQFIPVLMYHSIAYEQGNELRVPKEVFREQMKYLKENGYTTLTLDELYSFLVKNKPIPEKSIVITFDDGYKDNYENAYPVLKEFGLNATVFVITSSVDNEKDYLTSSQLKEMDKNGVDIESHTVNHDDLTKIPYDKQVETLKNSKDYLEKLLNKKIKYIAYPYGKWNDEAIKAAKDSGYIMAVTTVGGWSNKKQGIYTLDRVYISANHGMNEFKRRITNPKYNGIDSGNKKISK